MAIDFEKWIEDQMPDNFIPRDRKRCLRICFRKAAKMMKRGYPLDYMEREIRRIIYRWIAGTQIEINVPLGEEKK